MEYTRELTCENLGQVGERVERCAETFSEYRHLKLELGRIRQLQQALADQRGTPFARNSVLDRYADPPTHTYTHLPLTHCTPHAHT